jgi:transposase
MKRVRYPAEFEAEAVKQVTERGHGVVDVAKRLGMSDKSLYLWVRLAKEQPGVGTGENASLKAEVTRLKAELKRANEERDILKNCPRRTPRPMWVETRSYSYTAVARRQ